MPLLFVGLALACGVAGLVTLVRGRRNVVQAQRFAGRTALILSVPALIISVVLGLVVWLMVGFSTWCF